LSGSGPLASNSAPASSVAANAAESTAEQSLRELNRSLEEIGINPDSISLIRRAQLLPLANDPTALREYFRTSGVTGTVTESAPTPNSQGILDRISATHGSQPLTPTAPDGPGSELDVSA
jgi:hypothetical protein